MLKRYLCASFVILALCCIGHNAKADSRFFPPDNISDCSGANGGLLVWDGVNPVKCIKIPDTCPPGQLPAFVNGSLNCQPASVTGNGICSPGKIAFQITGLASPGVNRGTYNCCYPNGTSCEFDSVPLGSCIPSGFPDGQHNLYNTSALNPATIAAGVSTSCGQASGYAMNCCSKQAQWTQIVQDNYGILALSVDQFNNPMTASSNTYACLCR